MKRFQLFILLFGLSIAAQSVMAQRDGGKYQPTVYMVAIEEVDTLYDCPMQAAAARRSMAAAMARESFAMTQREGFQQVHNPQFIFSTSDNRFSLGIGGYINLRTSYDFKGAMDNIDFVPYDIPMTTTYSNRQRVMMDATTSRLFTKAVVNTSSIGQIVTFVDMDFRGGEEFSYTPRLRSAYVSLLGFTAGRDITTFCDLQAAPLTVDFQGPNAYNFNFATLLRYEKAFGQDHFKFGVAAEMPKVSGTYGEEFAPIAQRVPDFPMYFQYAWGRNRQSHFRASGVLRNMYMHNLSTDKNTSLFGWGVQASGRIETCDFFTLYFNGIYGQGITPYIQDLTGRGLDFTPNPENASQIQTMPMWAWQAAGQINIIPTKLFASGGYSAAYVDKKNGFYAEDEYHRGTYLFGNLFYQATDNLRLAAEYLRGSRKNMNDEKATANRVSIMIQYNF